MKKSLILVLIYFACQFVSVFLAKLIGLGVHFLGQGTFSNYPTSANANVELVWSLMLGFVLMGIYLWKKGYLTGDPRLWSPVTPKFIAGSAFFGVSVLFLTTLLESVLSFMPDLMTDTFQSITSSPMGLLSVALLGPVLEEMLFRGAITKELLKRYQPVKAILLSALIFGIFHVNPAQVIPAFLIGILLAWLYYKTGSLMPVILLHVINNSVSCILSDAYPDADTLGDIIPSPALYIYAGIAVLLIVLLFPVLNAYQRPSVSRDKGDSDQIQTL